MKNSYILLGVFILGVISGILYIGNILLDHNFKEVHKEQNVTFQLYQLNHSIIILKDKISENTFKGYIYKIDNRENKSLVYIKIIDGDTFYINNTKIRIYGIDALEYKHPQKKYVIHYLEKFGKDVITSCLDFYGYLARNFLIKEFEKALKENKSLIIITTGVDPYNRILGEIGIYQNSLATNLYCPCKHTNLKTHINIDSFSISVKYTYICKDKNASIKTCPYVIDNYQKIGPQMIIKGLALSYNNIYQSLEQIARKKKVGLWKDCIK